MINKIFYDFQQLSTFQKWNLLSVLKSKGMTSEFMMSESVERMTNIDTFLERMCITGYQAPNYFHRL